MVTGTSFISHFSISYLYWLLVMLSGQVDTLVRLALLPLPVREGGGGRLRGPGRIIPTLHTITMLC